MDDPADAPHIAARADLDQAADDLAAAFVDDPIFNWFMRNDAKREAARRRFFRVILKEAAFPDGQIERPASGGGAACGCRRRTSARNLCIEKSAPCPCS